MCSFDRASGRHRRVCHRRLARAAGIEEFATSSITHASLSLSLSLIRAGSTEKQIIDNEGPPVSSLGETAGLSGWLFQKTLYGTDEPLPENDVTGMIRGSCSVVGGATGEDQLCSYEIVLRVDGPITLGTIIAGGSILQNVGGYVLIEGVGDAFSREEGGIVTLQYMPNNPKHMEVIINFGP